MHASIGEASKQNQGPTKEQVYGLTKRVDKYFDIDPEGRARCIMTQLHQHDYRVWAGRAGSPDLYTYIHIWLQQGAPIGILRETEPAGIFPRSRQE